MTDKKLTVYKNFLEETDFKKVQEYCDYCLTDEDTPVRTSYQSWADWLIRDSFVAFIHDVPVDHEVYSIVENKVSSVLPDYNVKCVLFHYWTKFSYIPWHNDTNHDAACTIYLNEEWDSNNGGYFLFFADTHRIEALPVERNKAVIQEGGIMHSTTPVTVDGNVKKTAQIFLEHKE